MSSPVENNERQPRNWKRIIRITALVLALVLCLAFLAPRAGEIVVALGRQNPVSVAAALIVAAAATYATFLSWRELLIGVGHRLPIGACQRIFFLSQIGKYIPGSVWAIAAQADLGREHKVPPVKSVAVGILTLMISCAAGVSAAALTLVLVLPNALGHYWYVLLFLPAALLALHPAVLARTIALAGRLLRRDFDAVRLPLRSTARAFGWALVAWILFGAHIAILSAAIEPLSPSTLPLAIGSYALAWLVGFLVFFLPAGLGGREAILTALLVAGSALTPSAAVSIAVMSRVVLTLTDLSLALIAGASRRREKSTRVTTDSTE